MTYNHVYLITFGTGVDISENYILCIEIEVCNFHGYNNARTLVFVAQQSATKIGQSYMQVKLLIVTRYISKTSKNSNSRNHSANKTTYISTELYSKDDYVKVTFLVAIFQILECNLNNSFNLKLLHRICLLDI